MIKYDFFLELNLFSHLLFGFEVSLGSRELSPRILRSRSHCASLNVSRCAVIPNEPK